MQRIAPTFGTSFAVIGLALCLCVAPALAKPQGGKGGGGGGGHAGGGGGHATHVGGGGGGGGHGAAHFSVRHATVSHAAVAHAAVAHAASRSSRFSAARGSHFHAHAASTTHFTHVTPSTVHSLATTAARPLTRSARFAPLARTAAFSPRSFAARRQFAGDPAFRSFSGRGWHPDHHLGWIGPLFWPYAYGDFFYYALWPYDYYDVDPFWAYGYGDIYEAIFSPYGYDEYVEGPGAPARMAKLTQGMAQSCDEEAAEVTGWPIDQIQSAVQPNQQQTALLDDLGNAVVQASHEIKMHCPTSVAFAPTARLAEMQQRLQTLVGAVSIVSPPLAKFYDALSDEQKARFNDIAPPAPNAAAGGQAPQGQQAASSPQAQCNASILAWPTDQIDHVVQPNDAQRVKLEALQSAAAHAADMIKAACPSEVPATPPSRLDAIGARLQAMLHAVETVQPAVTDFYNSLGDDQKARFNTMGKQLFAQNQ